MVCRKILIIEDDTDAADVLEAYLRRDSFDVLIAENGTKGLEMARRLKPDLILLDIMLPGISGTEVLASIRRDSDVPVIMVTAMGRRRNVLAHCAMALTISLLSLIFLVKSLRESRLYCAARAR
jgi:DNA-binding response OmpR family regulator